MEEHQVQGERQNPNHGEHDQHLAAPEMHGWFFEVAVGSDGLKQREVSENLPPCRIVGGAAAMTLINHDQIKKSGREFPEKLQTFFRVPCMA